MKKSIQLLCFILSILYFSIQMNSQIKFSLKGERVSLFGKSSDIVSMNPIFKLENGTIHNKNKSLKINKLPSNLKNQNLAYGFLFFTGNGNSNFKNEVVFLIENYDGKTPKLYLDSNGNLDFTDDKAPQIFKEEKLKVRLKNEFKNSGYLTYKLYKSQIRQENSSRLINRYQGKYHKSKILSTEYWFSSERLSVNISRQNIDGLTVTILGYDGNADGLLKFDSSEYGDRIAIIGNDIDINQDLNQFIRTAEKINYNALFKLGNKNYRLQNINSDGSYLTLKESNLKITSKIGINSNISNLKFPLINGKEVTIRDLLKKNKYILLDFGATWCGGCRKQEAIIKKLFKSQKISIVGLFPSDKKENVLSYVSKRNINWPVGLLSKEMKSKLLVNAYPTYMLISKKGKIIKIDMNSENITSYLSQL